MTATGTESGRPVTYTAAPADVCVPSGENGAQIDLVGIGQCTVTAHQAEYLPVFLRADDVSRSFDVTPADLTITPDNRTRVYGADTPTYTASFDGLANGDTQADLGDLTFAGAPADAGVGDYDITASGATNPNYDITYATGTEEVTPASLRITADDQTQVYGAPDPTYTAGVDGLVNGDTESDVSGLGFAGPPSGSDVGDVRHHAVRSHQPQLRHRLRRRHPDRSPPRPSPSPPTTRPRSTAPPTPRTPRRTTGSSTATPGPSSRASRSTGRPPVPTSGATTSPRPGPATPTTTSTTPPAPRPSPPRPSPSPPTTRPRSTARPTRSSPRRTTGSSTATPRPTSPA